MKPPLVKLKENYQFENAYNEIVEIKKGTVFTVCAPDSYTKPGFTNLLWKCGRTALDYSIIKIETKYLRPHNPIAQKKAIQNKLKD